MTDDTPGPTAPRNPPPSRRRSDIQDPLAPFPTETEVDATRKAEARARSAPACGARVIDHLGLAETPPTSSGGPGTPRP